MVGFIQIAFIRADQDEDAAEDAYEVWRFMVDEQYQGKGYGKEALLKAIDYVKSFPVGPARELYLSYVPGNSHASSLYEALGFVRNGKMDGEEVIMVYDLTQ